MPVKTKIFFLGATGYIGGTVLKCLLQHRAAPKFEVTALVRNPTKFPLFVRVGVKAIFGTLDDAALLERQASESDVVFACADYNHVQSYEAILRGLKKRHQLTGTAPIFFHTSGTDLIGDSADGRYPADIFWDDMDLAQLTKISDRRPTDHLVLEADRQGYIQTTIVLPSTVYGFASGPLVNLGIQNPHPHESEIPELVEACLLRKRAGMVDLGLNIWTHVHLDDLGDLYVAVYDAILDGRARHGVEGMYFAENGKSSGREIAEQVGKAFVELGVSRPGEGAPTSFNDMDYAKNKDLEEWWGSNAYCTANRARTMGWKPNYTTEDMMEYVRREVQWQLKHKTHLC